MSIVQWDAPHFKQNEPSRHDQKKERKAITDLNWRTVCREVDKRDGKSCRGCDKRSDPEATGTLQRGHRHHIIYRSAGGMDTSDNLVTLCADCHNDEHQNRLRIEGNPNEALRFSRKDALDMWFYCREEIAVRVIRRD